MSRVFLAASLACAAMASALLPVSADGRGYARLDEVGRPFAAGWAEPGRFEALTATGMDDVHYEIGEAWRIRASGDARAIAQLRYVIEDGALIVGRISNQRERYGKVRIEVTAPTLRAVTAAGSGRLDAERIGGARASAIVAGSGSMVVRRVDGERLDATIAGSGGLDIAGRSTRADITIAGSGRLAGDNLTTGSAAVTIAGSGSARFRSPGAIKATIAGSGSVAVTGTTDCSSTRMGSGRLICTG